jgi:hypothetical protein
VPGLDIGVDGVSDAEAIGSGGNAVVYRAYETDHDRWVAVKLLRGLGDEDQRRRFDRERRAMGRLSEHEGIVTIHSSGISTRGEPFLVMSLLESGSLQDRIDNAGPVPWGEAVELMKTVARTVHFAHQQEVIHRDLKPANIMLSASGYPLVADFGIAKQTGSSASLESTAITMTPAYSPPEVIEGAAATVSADVYALGATLFALVAGSPPFVTASDESLFALLRRVADDPVRDLRPDGIPDHVCDAIEHAMAKAPEDRPRSAAEFALLLDPDGAAAGDVGPSDGHERRAEPTAETTVLVGAPAAEFAEQAPSSAGPTRRETTPLTRSTNADAQRPGSSQRRLIGIGALVGLVVVGGVASLALASGSDGNGETTTTADAVSVVSDSTAGAPASPEPDPASAEPFDADLVSQAPVGATGTVIVSEGGAFTRITADGSAEPEQLSVMLETLSAGSDRWVAPSRNGQWLAMETERFGCEDWSCLAVARSDVSEVSVVRAAGELVHPQDWGAISDDGSLVIFTADGGPHQLDLFMVQRVSDADWSEPVGLTDESPHAFNERGRITRDGSAVLFDCGPSQYGLEGTGICRVLLDGSGFEQLVSPEDGAGATSANAARSADEAPDGSIVFEADWGNAERLWRMSQEGTTVLLGFDNDNSPCLLPDGSIVSLWHGRQGNNDGLAELKVQSPDSPIYEMLIIDSDVTDSGIQCAR